jgi:3'(2'), 5'-bisphosphate nucleotidase
MQLSSLLDLALDASRMGCKEILEVYQSNDFQTEAKGDSSPLTIADKRAHEAIVSILKSSHLPILSEEGKSISFEERKHWEYFWMVDPLDGTKEFIKRNGEFTVNIALIKNGVPVMGVVQVPVTGETYYGGVGLGVFLKLNGSVKELPVRKPVDLKQPGLRVVASRSHMNDETQQFIDALQNPSLVSSGSSLKFMLLAGGKADVYPRFAPTMEWDTAAAHAVVNAAGLKVFKQHSTSELVYNKEDLLNPYFICL